MGHSGTAREAHDREFIGVIGAGGGKRALHRAEKSGRLLDFSSILFVPPGGAERKGRRPDVPRLSVAAVYKIA